MAAITIDSDADEVRCSYLAEFFVKHKISIRKQRKGNIVRFLEMFDFISRIAGADADHLYLAPVLWVAFNITKYFI